MKRTITCNTEFADDMVLLSENQTSINKMLKHLRESHEEHEKKINANKIVTGTSETTADITIGWENVEQVSSFKYLGRIRDISEDRKYEKEIKVRIIDREREIQYKELFLSSEEQNVQEKIG